VRLPPGSSRPLKALAALAQRQGAPLYLVGGCVRDGLLGASTKDLDLVTEADPRALAEAGVRRWGGSFEAFDRFGTVRIALGGGGRIDIARARAETYAEPAALPDVRPSTLIEDLRRRDFTVNAMARRLTPRGAGGLIDPHGGAGDLKARRLRVLHPASFQDDPTRLFRAARYAGRLGLTLESRTAAWAREAVEAGSARRLSRERVRQEIVRILEEEDPGPAFRRMKAWGFLEVVHPRLRWIDAAARLDGAHARLGLCLLAMGARSGEELLRSLPLCRADAKALRLALSLAKEKASPRSRLPGLTARVLAARFPRLPAKALEPLLVSGEDLKDLGVPPGEAYRRLLAKAGRAQWKGEFTTRGRAKAWLSR
jgi:tRNA nucleotidyltransferase (CCA-adding enzyme)